MKTIENLRSQVLLGYFWISGHRYHVESPGSLVPPRHFEVPCPRISPVDVPGPGLTFSVCL